MGRGTFGEVRDGSEDPSGGPGRNVGSSGRSGTGRGTLGEAQDRFGDPPEFRDGSGTLEKVRDG